MEDFKKEVIGERIKKARIISDKSFKFSQYSLKHCLVYQGNGKAPDKRYDKNVTGLCLFISPKNEKTFYAFKLVKMYNKKKGRTEKNACYKSLFRLSDTKGFKYSDVKNKLKETLDSMTDIVANKQQDKLFGHYCKLFLKDGTEGLRLKDEDIAYKKSTKVRYKSYIKTYLLLQHKNKKRIKTMTVSRIYKGQLYSRPLKELRMKDFTKGHIEDFKDRMREFGPTANNIMHTISIIFKWCKNQGYYSGPNPCDDVMHYPERKVKAKLTDQDTDTLIAEITGKAYDYNGNPHFYTCVGLHLFTGKRSAELFGLRWKPPVSQEEKENCTGWLVEDWEESHKFFIWDNKLREEETVHLDEVSLGLLKRLHASKFTTQTWCLKSEFVFPQHWHINKHVTYTSYQKPLARLNKKLGFTKLEGDNISNVKGERKIFTMKIARKTFGTYIARTKGVELASRKLGHTNTKTTREHYIVPDQEEMKVENIYQRRVKKDEIIQGVIENKKKKI
jgi:integrase